MTEQEKTDHLLAAAKKAAQIKAGTVSSKIMDRRDFFEEAQQEAFIRLWENYQQGRIDFENPRFKGYLNQLASYAVTDYIRNKVLRTRDGSTFHLLLWECPVCGASYNKKDRVLQKDYQKKSGHICDCGTKIDWWRINFVVPFSVLEHHGSSVFNANQSFDVADPSSDQEIEAIDLKIDVNEFLQHLSEREEKYLKARFMNELTFSRIGKEVLKISESRACGIRFEILERAKEVANYFFEDVA